MWIIPIFFYTSSEIAGNVPVVSDNQQGEFLFEKVERKSKAIRVLKSIYQPIEEIKTTERTSMLMSNWYSHLSREERERASEVLEKEVLVKTEQKRKHYLKNISNNFEQYLKGVGLTREDFLKTIASLDREEKDPFSDSATVFYSSVLKMEEYTTCVFDKLFLGATQLNGWEKRFKQLFGLKGEELKKAMQDFLLEASDEVTRLMRLFRRNVKRTFQTLEVKTVDLATGGDEAKIVVDKRLDRTKILELFKAITQEENRQKEGRKTDDVENAPIARLIMARPDNDLVMAEGECGNNGLNKTERLRKLANVLMDIDNGSEMAKSGEELIKKAHFLIEKMKREETELQDKGIKIEKGKFMEEFLGFLQSMENGFFVRKEEQDGFYFCFMNEQNRLTEMSWQDIENRFKKFKEDVYLFRREMKIEKRRSNLEEPL